MNEHLRAKTNGLRTLLETLLKPQPTRDLPLRQSRQRKVRAGYTKNHGTPRNPARVHMAKESRRRNRR